MIPDIRCGNRGYSAGCETDQCNIKYMCGIIEGMHYPKEHCELDMSCSSQVPSQVPSRMPKLTVMRLLLGAITIFSMIAQCYAQDVEPPKLISMSNLINTTWVSENIDNGTVALIKESGEVIFDIRVVTNSSAVNKARRDTAYDVHFTGQMTFWKQAKEVASGTWWSEWEKTSPCQFTSSQGGSLSFSSTMAKSISKGVNVNIPIRVLSAIITTSIAETRSVTTTGVCQIGPYSRCSIWSQMRMVWADVQWQDCFSDIFGTVCGKYSEYLRVDAPYASSGNTNMNYGCSYGDNAGCES